MSVLVYVCGALALAGVLFAVAGPQLFSGQKQDKRLQKVASNERPAKGGGRGGRKIDKAQQRRKAVEETLKELEQKQQARKNISLRGKLLQAGLKMEPRNFHILSAFLALGGGAVVLLGMQNTLAALPAAIVSGYGLPRLALAQITKRRQKKFLLEFPNALDVIVRGVRSGLPINECLKIVAKESSEPVGPEFQRLVEAQRVGIPQQQALARFFERMPVSEVNFFIIVLTIQQQAGGNLSEALGNLSNVLRSRKEMKAKINAMSTEAKASAAIIGALPPGVAGIVYLTSPDYIMPLFTEPMGHMMLIGSGLWMLMGIFIMRQMINFDF